jgi:hypothetical protein
MPVAEGETVTLNIVGKTTESLPLTIRGQRERENAHIGKADPIWDTAFTTKFSAKPKEDAPMVTPKGAAKVITEFLDRVAEINWLAETQHQELASTLSEMKANGIDGFSLSSAADEDMDTANIAENDVTRTHYGVTTKNAEGETIVADMGFVATLARRIEWERFIFACGPVHKARFAATKDGALGITYEGKDKDPEAILAHKRSLKAAWLDRFGSLPSVEEIENSRARAAFYGKPVLAMMDEAQYEAHRKSRLFGDEDPDPMRVEFHAEDLRGKDDRGYAGPKGWLGLDDDETDDGYFEYPEE